MPLASKFFMPLYIPLWRVPTSRRRNDGRIQIVAFCAEDHEYSLGLVRNTEETNRSQTALSLTADPRLDILLNRAVLFKDLPEVLG
jgi:hypothetical protein